MLETVLAIEAVKARQEADEAKAQIAALTAALREIMEGYGPNHLSKFARDVATKALDGHTAEMVAVKREQLERWEKWADVLQHRGLRDELRALLSGTPSPKEGE